MAKKSILEQMSATEEFIPTFEKASRGLLDISLMGISKDYKKKKISKEQAEDRIIKKFAKLRLHFNKNYLVKKKEPFVQALMYQYLREKLGNLVKREEILTRRGRIDFLIGDVGVEVKIFRKFADFNRLASEMHQYTKKVKKIIIPYIIAGGDTSKSEIENELRNLSKRYNEIKAYFELNLEGEKTAKIVRTNKRKQRTKEKKTIDMRKELGFDILQK